MKLTIFLFILSEFMIGSGVWELILVNEGFEVVALHRFLFIPEHFNLMYWSIISILTGFISCALGAWRFIRLP